MQYMMKYLDWFNRSKNGHSVTSDLWPRGLKLTAVHTH